jgi:uncharacterized protein (TIGR02996 family)
MIDEPVLLSAILANPGDDRPRLLYADWLEQQGQCDRARLIRLQIELALLPENTEPSIALKNEEEQLEEACENYLPALDGISWGGFYRGFVSTVYADNAAAFRRQAKSIAEVGSVYRVVFEKPDGFAGLAEVPVLSRFTELRVGDEPNWGLRKGDPNHPFNAELQVVLESAYCPRLRNLELVTCQLGPRGAKALADCPRLESLVDLCLLDNYIGDEGLAALAASPYLTSLRNLRIDLNYIGPAGIEALAASESFGGLEELFLGEDWPNPIGPAACEALGSSPYLKSLRELSLHDDIGALGAAALAQAPNLASLNYLDIRCAINPEGGRALAASPYLRQLKRLWLYGSWMQDEGVKDLACSPILATVEELDLTYNGLTDEGAEAIAASRFLENLNQGGLNIQSGNSLTENGIQVLRARFGDRLSAGRSIAPTEIPCDSPIQKPEEES